MNKNYMYSFVTVVVLSTVAYVGTQELGLQFLFGVVSFYLAFAVFIIGISTNVISWARSPVPFRITTTCGQQRSLPWIKDNVVDNPSSVFFVFVRMLLEILCFRSLFRNTRMKFDGNFKLAYQLDIFLWLGALVFHYSFLVVFVRHLRFFTEPVVFFVPILEKIDSFFKVELLYDVFQLGLPCVFLSGFVLFVAVIYLLLRRIFIPHVRYISLVADFFPLFLIVGIALTGILMRYFNKIDIVAVKGFALSLVSFDPSIPTNELGGLFYAHFFMVSVLMAYFPFSKLMHMVGIFLSPTRNMTANTRQVRHVNPWNYPVRVHTYEEYENEYRDKMINAGIPVEITLEEKSG